VIKPEAAMTDDRDDDDGRPKSARPRRKSIDEVLRGVARPDWRSPLFWWLMDHHDELRQAEVNTGRGVSWRKLCVDFVDLGVTLADGRPVKPATARITWQRVRKEIVRVEERRAREQAEREARRAADPRRNMPSRFGKAAPAGPPLSDVQPRPKPADSPSTNRQLVPVAVPGLPARVADQSGDEPWRKMELPEALAKMRVLDWDGQELDLRQFFRDDGVPEPWEAPGLSDVERIGLMRAQIWSRAKEWARYRPYERRFMKKW